MFLQDFFELITNQIQENLIRCNQMAIHIELNHTLRTVYSSHLAIVFKRLQLLLRDILSVLNNFVWSARNITDRCIGRLEPDGITITISPAILTILRNPVTQILPQRHVTRIQSVFFTAKNILGLTVNFFLCKTHYPVE